MIVTFVDTEGRSWEVWEAHPTLRERRGQEERRAAVRGIPDRRKHASAGYSRGWLVFRSADDRRRLRMIPDGWHKLGEQGLRDLLEQAARPTGAMRWSE